MKKAKVSFFPIDETGVLHLDFAKGPFGEAVEALEGDGVGFFDALNGLLGVTFDDVAIDGDRQALVFKNISVEIRSRKGKISYSVHTGSRKKPAA